MSKEYLELFAGMFLIYAFFRLLIRWGLENAPPPSPPFSAGNFPATPIDTTPLTGRLREVRQNIAAAAHAHSVPSRRPELVKRRRQEIARLSFFQKLPPAPPPPDDHEPGSRALLA